MGVRPVVSGAIGENHSDKNHQRQAHVSVPVEPRLGQKIDSAGEDALNQVWRGGFCHGWFSVIILQTQSTVF
jgi:hypothetical protein